MRKMPIVATGLLLVAGSAHAQQADLRFGPAARPPAPDRCTKGNNRTDYDKRSGHVLGKQYKLIDAPPANQIYTVYNLVDGCPQPVVLRKGIGGNRKQPVSPTRSPPRASKAGAH